MENERLAKLEESSKWIASKVDRIDRKIDVLLEFKWKVIGASMVMAFLATAVAEFFRR